MTTLRIELSEDVAQRVAAAATARGVAPEELASEAVAEKFPARRKVGFVGIGSSGEGGGDIGRRHREIIVADLADKTAADV